MATITYDQNSIEITIKGLEKEIQVIRNAVSSNDKLLTTYTRRYKTIPRVFKDAVKQKQRLSWTIWSMEDELAKLREQQKELNEAISFAEGKHDWRECCNAGVADNKILGWMQNIAEQFFSADDKCMCACHFSSFIECGANGRIADKRSSRKQPNRSDGNVMPAALQQY